MHETNGSPKDLRQPAAALDDFEELVRRDEFAGPDGQVETDNPVETDGAEVTGITHGDVAGRRPVGGAG
jgi:hypothetical protein